MTPDKSLVAKLRTGAQQHKYWPGGAALMTEAADRLEALIAPVEGMETTVEERAALADLCAEYPEQSRTTEKLLRDHDRLTALLAAEKRMRDESAWHWIDINEECGKALVAAEARTADLERDLYNTASNRDDWRARAEKAEAALREAERLVSNMWGWHVIRDPADTETINTLRGLLRAALNPTPKEPS